ncbi:hypothetical protein [Tenacibaculum geojense]|uniref:Uncharacterized protein n=1 Tax=Tenacibaculum geojense TaxID=915352 RepID=A0ABW3JQS8_9FLAO
MKKTISLIFGFLILTSFVGISIGNLLPTEKQSVEKIFANDRIEIRITNHGGFGANIIGISKLTIKRKNNGKEYRVKYNDKLDEKKSEFKITQVEFEELKNIFFDLIKVNDSKKVLNGDCVIIDKNYELKSSGLKMIIKPNKNSSELFALDGWIYKSERE